MEEKKERWSRHRTKRQPVSLLLSRIRLDDKKLLRDTNTEEAFEAHWCGKFPNGGKKSFPI